ncbi:hypothetical protein EN794_032545 [Mesorhizobium sp. M00.F.Ca.ET.151.01.1.1]|nr:hypothetical protein EN794_032545 [Mesorhizobium sp. M00.F.Ca.ET.151.01.1.1]
MAQSDQSTTLRELFNRDFGVDLPIAGGGGARSDPIVLEQVVTVEHAAILAETVLQLYHRGRATADGSEIFWKIIGSGPTTSKQQRYNIARVLIEKDEIITERVSYYFVAPATSHQVWPRAVAASETAQGFSFPLNLGWLDHIRRHDYQADAPGMGYSHHYGATGIDYTAYVYNGGGNAHSSEMDSLTLTALEKKLPKTAHADSAEMVMLLLVYPEMEARKTSPQLRWALSGPRI